jgi:transposase-like protein
MQRLRYTAEFKAEAVKQVVDKGHTVVDVAARLGLGEGILYNGVRKSKAAYGSVFGTCSFKPTYPSSNSPACAES